MFQPPGDGAFRSEDVGGGQQRGFH
jgi:hypothetical protein